MPGVTVTLTLQVVISVVPLPVPSASDYRLLPSSLQPDNAYLIMCTRSRDLPIRLIL